MSINLSNSIPAAPSGGSLVTFQGDGAGNVSAYIAASSAVLPGQNFTAQTANIGSATLLAVTAAGMYRISGYAIVTTPDGASSTLPKVTIGWTDTDSNVVQALDLTATNAGNTTTTIQQGSIVIDAASASNITYLTAGYASGTPATMQYAVHLTVEKLF